MNVKDWIHAVVILFGKSISVHLCPYSLRSCRAVVWHEAGQGNVSQQQSLYFTQLCLIGQGLEQSGSTDKHRQRSSEPYQRGGGGGQGGDCGGNAVDDQSSGADAQRKNTETT